jgi:ABC-2 type transport system permease protein
MLFRIGNLAQKELLQLTRDVMILILVLIGPMLQLVLIARATTQGFHHQPIVVVDQDHSQLSRELITAFNNTEDLKVVAYLDSPDQIDEWLDQTQAIMAVTIPAGLEADLARGTPQVQLLVDGTKSASASYALGAASGAISVVAARQQAATGGVLPAIIVRPQVRFNPTFDAGFFVISAQLGFIIYQVGLIVAALGLTRERELGTLEQLLVTPLQRIELIIGKAIPAVIVGVVNFLIMALIVTQGFNLPMRGSFGLLFFLSVLFIIAEVGWGLMISAFSHTQQQAVLFVFVLAMVDMAFSGYTVPVERLPQVMQWLAQLFPFQHYLQILRGVMLRGADLSTLWPQAVALVVLAMASVGVALVALRRRLD